MSISIGDVLVRSKSGHPTWTVIDTSRRKVKLQCSNTFGGDQSIIERSWKPDPENPDRVFIDGMLGDSWIVTTK